MCSEWQDLHLTLISAALKYGANLCLSSIGPSRPETLCLVQSSFFFPPSSSPFFWKVKNTLAVPSFENRATPKTIRAGGREMCAENSQGAETLGLRRFGFPLSGFQKQRNSRENQGRTSPQANAVAATPDSPPLPSCSHSHARTNFMSTCTDTQTARQGKGGFMQPSTRHTSSLVIQPC